MASAEEIIDWDEAMQQCGEDEEFLHELLNDFRGELETQLASIAETIQNPGEAPYHLIMRAAHVVKGAAANLMCGQLRTAAMNLEQTSKQVHEAGGTSAPQDIQAQVQLRYSELQVAVQNYMELLKTLNI
ncbi:hypothetical protein FisN_1Lh301 [Fistulifera solaris]|uniref:HPt domain-containing protein n=1 Tax=Fistulifera solaris TaxID=1519565 RepID=A0A1Z5K451_FISSO|nr:hypothetical protein FisN_1Lh301 [Fistulifera solaris]|eukprot:GAX21027.1 hypothetical protein FisN_1Lh301 [Fistulifera solaris]